MTSTSTPSTASDGLTVEPSPDDALKARHRAVWASGDYASVAAELIPTLGPVLVEAAGVAHGDRVLDVAAGTGNASLPAARAGGQVTATDLTPELLDTGRALAEADGLRPGVADRRRRAAAVRGRVVRHRPVLRRASCSRPHHQEAADELVRVCRPGGTVALLSWTPSGFIGQLFATLRPYAPPPPPGAQPPPLWGDEDHVRGLLGDRVSDVRATRQALEVSMFRTPAEFREFFKAAYGPTVAVYRSLADDPARAAELDAALDDLAVRHGLGTEGATMSWEYLLLVATRA